jgi:hypothetical protein
MLVKIVEIVQERDGQEFVIAASDGASRVRIVVVLLRGQFLARFVDSEIIENTDRQERLHVPHFRRRRVILWRWRWRWVYEQETTSVDSSLSHRSHFDHLVRGKVRIVERILVAMRHKYVQEQSPTELGCCRICHHHHLRVFAPITIRDVEPGNRGVYCFAIAVQSATIARVNVYCYIVMLLEVIRYRVLKR